MLQRDYIMRLIADLGKVIARMLSLKMPAEGKQMQEEVCNGLKIAGLGDDPRKVDADAVAGIEDERVLASLSEILSIYLAEKDDPELSRVRKLVIRRLKEKKTITLNL